MLEDFGFGASGSGLLYGTPLKDVEGLHNLAHLDDPGWTGLRVGMTVARSFGASVGRGSSCSGGSGGS